MPECHRPASISAPEFILRNGMEGNDILTRFDEIRKDVEALSNSLVNVRFDELKGAIVEQVKAIFGDHSQALFDSELERMSDFSSCPSKQDCMDDLARSQQEILAAFKRDDFGGALMAVEDMESTISGKRTRCRDPKCSRYTLEALHEVKLLVSITDNLKFRDYIQPDTGFMRLSAGRIRRGMGNEAGVDAETTSQLLEQLASAWRIDVLSLLAQDDLSFAEISRKVGLKTGHLQFHLRVLQENGYIRNNRRRRLHSITRKGMSALEALRDFSEHMK
jgi:DNA-binding HxlR family transcriptional regulator